MKMIKVLIIRKVIDALSGTRFYGITESGDIPDRFYKYANINGEDIEGYLLWVEPVMNVKGVEDFAGTEYEEVEIEADDDFKKRHLPKNVRWFVALRIPSTPKKP